MNHVDVYLNIEDALTDEQRQTFLDRFPAMRGAHVADILAIADDSDAEIGMVEDLWNLTAEPPVGFGACARALFYANGTVPTVAHVLALAAAARVS